jgi:DNA-binding ferritin-like protein
MDSTMSEKSNIELSDRTYDILRTLGKDADFLYDTINKYINDAQKENRQDLVDMWKTIRQDREKHVHMLKDALEKEFHK